MKEPNVKIAGFRGFDFTDAVECDEMTKRMLLREVLKPMRDGHYFADAHVTSTGDTLMLLVRNKRTGQHEVYDLKVRAHYIAEGEYPMPGSGKVVSEK